MKKTSYIITAAVLMCVALLSACGSSNNNGNATSTTSNGVKGAIPYSRGSSDPPRIGTPTIPLPK